MLAQDLFNDSVTSQGNSLLIYLTITSLEDEFSDGLSGRITKSNVWFDSSQKVDGGLVDSDKGAVVKLSESQESKNSDSSGVEFVNTSNSNDESQSGFGGNEDLTGEFCLHINRYLLVFWR